jgi:HemY protein
MNALKWLLTLLLTVPLAYLGFALARDPGRLSLRAWGWQVDTTLVLALVLLSIGFALIALLYWLLWRLPKWLLRRRTRTLQKQYRLGVIELFNARFARAQKKLAAGRQLPDQQDIAGIASAYAALQAGDHPYAAQALESAKHEPELAQVAAVLRAKIQLAQDDASGLAALQALAHEQPSVLTLQTLITELSARSRSQDALPFIAQLAKLQPGDSKLARNWATLLRDSLTNAATLDALQAIWGQISDKERALADVLARYAERAIALGAHETVEPLLRSALNKAPSDQLWHAFAKLPQASGQSGTDRLAFVEKSLDSQGESVGALLALAQLCQDRDMGVKAKQLIHRAQALYPSARGHAALASWAEREGDLALALSAYRQAIALSTPELFTRR